MLLCIHSHGLQQAGAVQGAHREGGGGPRRHQGEDGGASKAVQKIGEHMSAQGAADSKGDAGGGDAGSGSEGSKASGG